ncbi:MAG: MiaB/RimO family radical SAM methylthiotransferase [Candidatus Gottesmanbacteria bacterium]
MKSSFMSFSFGCRVNEAEKQILDQKLINIGFGWNEQHPTFYIINSCAITGKAEREVRQHIYQIRKKYPKTTIVVTGCSATLWMKNNTKPIGADYWIDNTNKETIPEFIHSLARRPLYTKTSSSSPDKFLTSGRMMIKIQEGCNRFCSYCIVPSLRGAVKSEAISDILKRILASKKPLKEVILTAINTEEFGKDTGETLMQLVNSILTHTKVERVSFGSIHPWSITDEFLSWYKYNKDNQRFVHFFHIPIQSGSDTILRLMNRQYTSHDLLDRLTKLHAINPNALLATDVIVGFPGEGEKEFKETYEFLKKSPISKFHVFRYSPRPGTAAINFKNEPTPQEKRERSRKLIELGKRKTKFTT